MRRPVIAIIVFAVAGGVAAWRFWPRAQQSPAPAQTPSGGTAEPGVAPLAAAAELVLQVNGTEGAELTPGTSVFFTVSLTGTTPEPSLRIGTPARPWFTDVTWETSDGKPFAVRIDRLGPPASYRFGKDPGATTPVPPDRSDEVLVDSSRVHQIEFGLTPEESGRLTAGTHDVRAVLNLTAAPTGDARLISNPVTITVLPAAGAPPSAAEDKRRLESMARFYLRSEKWEDAHRIALQLVEPEGRDAAAFILLADALSGLRRDDEALAAYQEALASLPKPLRESPDYIMARMEAVRQRLEASKQNKE